MAAPKGAEFDFNSKKNEKSAEIGPSNRRNMKAKFVEHTENSIKKLTRAKTRGTGTENAGGGHIGLIKTREKGRSACDIKDDGTCNKKDNNVTFLKESDFGQLPKREIASAVTKKDAGPMKKELGSGLLKKGSEALPEMKRDALAMSVSKKEAEILSVKNRKNKSKLYNTQLVEKKKDERLIPKIDETKSEVTTSETKKQSKDDKKSDRKENGNVKVDVDRPREIMNSDVTSSADVPSKPTLHSPDVMLNAKDSGWNIGDLAWGRVGQHPFWPCLIAVDHQNGQYTKIKRVGRGLNSVQQSLHVQFFGDRGRHSWIPVNCVIKYEGKEQFQRFADKILLEMKKKDKRISSAFIVKPASKPKWELAIKEAEESVPKAREDRITFFQELLPKRKTSEKVELGQKPVIVEKTSQLVRKMKRPDLNTEEKPSKLMKLEKGNGAMKVNDTDGKKFSDNNSSAAKKKRNKNKNEIGEFELSDASPSPPTNIPRLALFLRRNIRKTLRQ